MSAAAEGAPREWAPPHHDAYAVACVVCGAQRGEPCFRDGGLSNYWRRGPHQTRISAMAEQVAKEEQ